MMAALLGLAASGAPALAAQEHAAAARAGRQQATPDRHRPPPRQLARGRAPVRRRRHLPAAGRSRSAPRRRPAAVPRSLAHQAPGLHAARGRARGAGLHPERALDRAGAGRGAAAQGVRRRDGGDGALHPAGGRPAERGAPRRGLRALPADAVLLHPGDEPARPAALGRHRHRQHRGDGGARGHGVHRDRGDRDADAGVQGLHEDDLLPAARACRAASAEPPSRCCCWPS